MCVSQSRVRVILIAPYLQMMHSPHHATRTPVIMEECVRMALPLLDICASVQLAFMVPTVSTILMIVRKTLAKMEEFALTWQQITRANALENSPARTASTNVLDH